MKLHTFLAALLAERGLNPFTLSKQAGISHTTLWCWLHGTRVPGSANLERMLKHLAVSDTDRERAYRLHREAEIARASR